MSDPRFREAALNFLAKGQPRTLALLRELLTFKGASYQERAEKEVAALVRLCADLETDLSAQSRLVTEALIHFESYPGDGDYQGLSLLRKAQRSEGVGADLKTSEGRA